MASRKKIAYAILVALLLILVVYVLVSRTPGWEGGVDPAEGEVQRSSSGSGHDRDDVDVGRSPVEVTGNEAPRRGASPGGAPRIRSILPTDHSIKDGLEAMKAKATAGDDEAAVQLYVDLRTCSDVLTRGEEFVRSNGANVPDEVRNPTRQTLEKEFENCKGISQEDMRNFVEWLDMAAKRGDYQARIMWVDSFFDDKDSTWMIQHPDEVKEYKGRAMDYLNQLAGECSPDALSMLIGQYYRKGILTEKDPYKAYQYSLIYDQVSPGNVNSSNLPDMERSLSSSQMEQARATAGKFYDRHCR
ncbi:hypothetical protein [Dokdonella ginsengisoli]|uniref:Sel1 repeat family protein n=1 Tax=Dokdonella ginsengisoli TaxID=363846 RepID=A0ABV9R1E0_9GAMM